MKSHNRYRGVDSYALFCVQKQATQLIKYPGFSPGDFEDIEQDLVLYFLQEAPKFDPAKSSWKLHIGMIIKKRAIWLMLQAQAMKRGGRNRLLSFEEIVYTKPDTDVRLSLGEVLLSEQGMWGDPFLLWGEMSTDLRLDLQKVLDALPPRLQQVCEWLKDGNATDISRDTGIPRTTLSSAMGVLRKHMREAGLEKYLWELSSDSEVSAKPSGERATKETKNAGR